MIQNDQQVRAIVAFTDIKGFGAFLRRTSDQQTEFIPWWDKWRAMVDSFQDSTGYFVKRLGDGFMAVAEIEKPGDTVPVTLSFIKSLWTFSNRTKSHIRTKPSPRPDGFRVRVAQGIVWKEHSIQFGFDYVGDKLNLAEKMLHVHQEIGFVVHESVKELFSARVCKTSNAHFEKLEKVERRQSSIYGQDMNALWTLKKIKP